MDIKRIDSKPGILQDQTSKRADPQKVLGISSTPDSIESTVADSQFDQSIQQKLPDNSIDLNAGNEIFVAPGTAMDAYGEEIDVGEQRETPSPSEEEANALAKAKLENVSLNYFTGEPEGDKPQIKPGVLPKFFKG